MVQLWVLASMVIKLQVPEKMQTMLTFWANVTFSIKYQIRRVLVCIMLTVRARSFSVKMASS